MIRDAAHTLAEDAQRALARSIVHAAFRETIGRVSPETSYATRLRLARELLEELDRPALRPALARLGAE